MEGTKTLYYRPVLVLYRNHNRHHSITIGLGLGAATLAFRKAGLRTAYNLHLVLGYTESFFFPYSEMHGYFNFTDRYALYR